MSGQEKGPNLKDMLERFAMVNIGGKSRVMELATPTGPVRWLREEKDFKLFFGNCISTIQDRDENGTPVGKPKQVRLPDQWLAHPARKNYERLVYDMPGGPAEFRAGPKDFNAYQGFRVDPTPGAWDRNKAHILDIICDGNEEQFLWVLNWMAALFQFPGRRPESSIVMMGGQGTGKGHFANFMLGECFYPQQYIQVMGGNQLTERFNEHLSGKVLVFADESTWGGDHKAAGKLKGLVTEGTVTIERKFLPPIAEHNAMHVIIASNTDWPIPVDKDDRRFLVLRLPNTVRQDTRYFGALRKEFDELGGRAAMLHEMLAWQVDLELLKHPPQTKAKAELTERELRPVEVWWREVLHTGEIERGGWWLRVRKDTVHKHYMDFIASHYGQLREHRSTTSELAHYLRRTFSFQDKVARDKGVLTRFWLFPTLAECRAFWTKEYGTPSEDEWETPNNPHDIADDAPLQAGQDEENVDDDL